MPATATNVVQFIPRFANGVEIRQRRSDGYFPSEPMCRAHKKRFHDYTRLKGTQQFLADLALETGIPVSRLIDSEQRNPGGDYGSWVHELVAYNLAQWISTKFAIMVANWIKELAAGGAPPQEEVATAINSVVAGPQLEAAHAPITRADLEAATANIVSMLPQTRAEFTEPTRREIRYWLWRIRKGKCPITGKQLLDPETGAMLLDPDTNESLGQYHHIGMRTNNAFDNCIPIAVDAHIEAHNSRQKFEEIRTSIGPKFHDAIDAAKELDDAWVRARAERNRLEDERRQKEWDAQKSPGLLAQEKARAEFALKEQHDKSRAKPIDTTPLFGGDDEIPVKGGRISPRKRKRGSLRKAAQTGEEATAFGA